MADATGDNPRGRAASLVLKTAKGAGWVIAWRFATRNLGLVSTLVLARLLTPADFGLVAIATGFIAAIDALSAVGVEDALIRERALDRDLYDTGFTMNLARGLFTAAAIALAAWPVGAFFADLRLVPILLALALGALLGAFENIGIVDFRRTLAFHKEFQLQLTGRVLAVAATIALAVIFRSYWALVAGILVNRLARLVQSYWMSPYRPRVGLRSWRQIIGFSMWSWAVGVVAMLRERLEVIVVGRLLGAGSAGIFAIGAETGALPTTELVEPLYRALFSGFAEANRSGLSPAAAYVRVVSSTLLLSVPAALGISLVADPAIRVILGPRWLEALPLVWILAPPAAVTVIAHVSAAVLNAEGMPQISFRIAAVSTALKATLLIGLVTAFGLIGGAVAVALSLLVEQAMFLETTRRRLGLSIAAFVGEAWRPFFAGAVMAAVLAGCGLGWTQTEGGTAEAARELAAGMASGAAVYILALLVAWLAAGRPDGPELAAWRVAQSALRRVLQSGFARGALGSG